VDLFVAIPTRDKNALAPFLRWLLDDIFNAIRANRPAERIVIFIDEAAALGRFDAILTASGELPGYGGSLWTIWQDRAQMVTTYGEDGASTLLRTAEIVTLFDVPAVDPDESDRWSRALGDYTAMIDITSGGGQAPEKPSVATSPQVARLMTKEGLTAMASNELIVFPNSRHYARHPLRLRKTYAYADPRFKGLVEDVQPVGRV
jgi:type IV secretion system protein VirD4